MAVAWATTPWETAWTSLGTALRTARWRGSPPPTLSDSSILPATRVRLGHCSRQVQLESRLGASEVAGLANGPTGPVGPICARPPRVALDIRHTRRSVATHGPVAGEPPGDGLAPAVPSCPWPRCTETAGDMSYIRTRRTGRPASGVSDPRHPYAVPLALWCG